jgi:DNA-binding MarR family transcriptional regulator
MERVDELAERLRVVVRLMSHRARSLADLDAPTPIETLVLGLLDEQGEMTPSALSAAQHVRPQTMGQTLDTMEDHGWVERGAHPTDRRQILISLTSAGRKALAKGRRLRQAWLALELNRLSAKDHRTLASALTMLERFLNPKIQS